MPVMALAGWALRSIGATAGPSPPWDVVGTFHGGVAAAASEGAGAGPCSASRTTGSTASSRWPRPGRPLHLTGTTTAAPGGGGSLCLVDRIDF